jgi:serine/threonine protein kinase
VHVSDDPRVGTELAGYRIESRLGLGGMSVVYLAEDLRLKRRVALRLLAASLAEDESFRDRFLRESELAASIDHPNIVPIYEAGTIEDILFIAMRYVEGLDLNKRLHAARQASRRFAARCVRPGRTMCHARARCPARSGL